MAQPPELSLRYGAQKVLDLGALCEQQRLAIQKRFKPTIAGPVVPELESSKRNQKVIV